MLFFGFKDLDDFTDFIETGAQIAVMLFNCLKEMFFLFLGLGELRQIRGRGEHDHAAIHAGEVIFHIMRPGA